ncbi:MAG: hypothetical protein RJB08_1517 [Actinomycetota bacterium]|jgi:hypothetical protein
MTTNLDALVDRADLDEIIRQIDALCTHREWSTLAALRDKAAAAVKTGRQTWPCATLANYRLALHASPELAAASLQHPTSTFSIGPLTEVIAQHHTWDELAPYIDDAPLRGFVAYERALRGDTIDNDTALRAVLEIPITPAEWEPGYELPVYDDNGVTAPTPRLHLPATTKLRCVSAEIDDDPDIESAIRSVFEAWTTQSNGRVSFAAVSGGIDSALGALGLNEANVAPLEPAQVMSLVAWAGASGGAHGRRRGMAQGRFGAWWFATAMADALDEWPLPPGTMRAEMEELQWFSWTTDEPTLGWQLQLAIEDPFNDMSWAFTARDMS